LLLLFTQTVSGLEADLSDVAGLLASQEAVLAGLGQETAAAATASVARLAEYFLPAVAAL
jgi:hypothetical protein